MLADVDALKAKLGNCGAALNGKGVVLLEIRKSYAEFVEQRGGDGIAIGDQQTAILIVSQDVRQKLICHQAAAPMFASTSFQL
jgi:hypothetical protein